MTEFLCHRNYRRAAMNNKSESPLSEIDGLESGTDNELRYYSIDLNDKKDSTSTIRRNMAEALRKLADVITKYDYHVYSVTIRVEGRELLDQ